MNEIFVIVLMFASFVIGCVAGMEQWRKNADTNDIIEYKGLEYKVCYRVNNEGPSE